MLSIINIEINSSISVMNLCMLLLRYVCFFPILFSSCPRTFSLHTSLYIVNLIFMWLINIWCTILVYYVIIILAKIIITIMKIIATIITIISLIIIFYSLINSSFALFPFSPINFFNCYMKWTLYLHATSLHLKT